MLAQNFKTAAELGLTDEDVQGLIQTLGMLERDEVKHVPVQDTLWLRGKMPTVKRDFLFNMDNLYTKADCGTAACIAGTSDLFCGTHFIGAHKCLRMNLPDNLIALFCPPTRTVNWSDITVPQAATALRHYLTHGEPRWEEALA